MKVNELQSATDVKCDTRYYVVLPTKEAHHKVHPTDGAIGYAQKMHPKISMKIHNLVSEGITNIPEVTRALKYYVNHILCPDSKPSTSDRAYYPTVEDIRNHVYRPQKICQLSHIDQENLKLKIEKWQAEDPSKLFFFRPLSERECDNEKEARANDPFLFVHQDSWQKDLLIRYGNTITLIDATYKTTKYELPLFFISVKTNVGYSVVAEFVIESESASNISEALRVLSAWNPEWKPPYFMTDYSDAEITAVMEVFPDCKTYLCDFHREQCWERWVKNRKHGLSESNADLLLSYLRKCANAPPCESLVVDSNYKQEVDKLKQSPIWTSNKQVREWLETKWFTIPEVCVCMCT